MRKFRLLGLALCAVGFVSVDPADAGTEMVIDNSGQNYNYAPPPPPPPLPPQPLPVLRYVAVPRVVVYPRVIGVYGYHRVCPPRSYAGFIPRERVIER